MKILSNIDKITPPRRETTLVVSKTKGFNRDKYFTCNACLADSSFAKAFDGATPVPLTCPDTTQRVVWCAIRQASFRLTLAYNCPFRFVRWPNDRFLIVYSTRIALGLEIYRLE